MASDPNAIRVAIRIRPLNDRERAKEEVTKAVSVVPNRPQIYLPTVENKSFTYNHVFDTESTQASLYETCVLQTEKGSGMIDMLFKGLNATVLAYGQTGSGKTYTMGTALHSVNDLLSADCSTSAEITNASLLPFAGVIPRALCDIFARVNSIRKTHAVVVKITFLELYKDQIYDLLYTNSLKRKKSSTICVSESQCDLREDPLQGVVVSGLTELDVTTPAEALALLVSGSARRVTAATAMNMTSSRSHSIFSVHLTSQPLSSGCSDAEDSEDSSTASVIYSKFSFVDLAGSERQKRTQAVGERLQEGVAINQGLLALGNVISALGSRNSASGQQAHIPYRACKLTRLLQDSLGGNSLTLMLACVSPASDSLEETISTLRYADRAKQIKNKPIINVRSAAGDVVPAAELAKCRAENIHLKEQLIELRREVATLAGQSVLIDQGGSSSESQQQLVSALAHCEEELNHLNQMWAVVDAAFDDVKSLTVQMRSKIDDRFRNNRDQLISYMDGAVADMLALIASREKSLASLSNAQSLENGVKAESDANEDRADDNDDENGAEKSANLSSHSMDSSADEDTTSVKDESVIHRTLGHHKALAEQLHQLNKMLVKKEQLAATITSNEGQWSEMQSKHAADIAALETKLLSLEKERDQLVLSTSTISLPQPKKPKDETIVKLAENRRLKIQDLENDIHSLKKKISEQQRLIKIKTKVEQQGVKLANEIKDMKSQRVKLIRQMKEESEKTRQWKSAKEREVQKLKQCERKQQARMVKLENLHTKQMTVFKRKMEEAAAVNRRLKDLVDKQKAAKNMRNAAPSGGGTSAPSGVGGKASSSASRSMQIQSWVDGEVDLAVTTSTAQSGYRQLVQDKDDLSKQLQNIRKTMRTTMDGDDIEQAKKMAAQLQSEIDAREAQIEAMAGDLDLLSKDSCRSGPCNRFDNLSTIAEAKDMLDYLFGQLVAKSVEIRQCETDLNVCKTVRDEAVHNVQTLEAEIASLKQDHESAVINLHAENEERVLVLLNKLNDKRQIHGDSADMVEGRVGESQASTTLNKELARMANENSELRQQLAAKANAKAVKRPSASRVPPTTLTEYSSPEDSSDDGGASADDPDWVKTPIYRRFKKMRQATKWSQDDANDTVATTRDVTFTASVDVSGLETGGSTTCHCRTGCKTRHCMCVRSGAACSGACGCSRVTGVTCTNKGSHSNDTASLLDDSGPNSQSVVGNNMLAKVHREARMEDGEDGGSFTESKENVAVNQ